MLSSMIKDHQAKQNVRKEEQGNKLFGLQVNFIQNNGLHNHLTVEIKRKEAIASSNELTQALVDHLNVG